MIKKILPLLVTAIIAVNVVAQDAQPERQRPQVNREEVSKARELLSSDKELKKIHEKYQAALLKRLKELGVSEETAKLISQPRGGRGQGGWGNRQGGPGQDRPGGATNRFRTPGEPRAPRVKRD